MNAAPSSTHAPDDVYQYPGLLKRLACMLYEALLLLAIIFIASFLFTALTRFEGTGPVRPFFQVYVFAIMAYYFTWFWSLGRRTLAMKTWRLKVVGKDGGPILPRQAFLRYCLAWLCLAGIGIVWALFDRDGLFLHDRLAGTRLIGEKTSKNLPR